MHGKLFIISAPSGAGKTSLVNAVLAAQPQSCAITKLITYTSRSPRTGDVDGVDYHFVTAQEFEHKIASGFFLEWSGAYGNYYGTPRHILDEMSSGRSFIVVLDRAGVRSVVQKTEHAVPIWIDVPSLAVLEQRLRARGTETNEQIQYRLGLAQKELLEEKNSPLYAFRVVNNEFEVAKKELEVIISSIILG